MSNNIENVEVIVGEVIIDWCDGIISKLMGNSPFITPTIIYDYEENQYWYGYSKNYDTTCATIVEFDFDCGNICDMFELYPGDEYDDENKYSAFGEIVYESDFLDMATEYILDKIKESEYCSERLYSAIEEGLAKAIAENYSDADKKPLRL